jgi:hypothetical protein
VIVQPVPVGTPSRARRLLRVAAVMVPLALLTGVVAFGVLGPRPEAPGPLTALSPAPAAAQPDATPAPASTPDVAVVRGLPHYPSRVLGLAVRSVSEVLAARAAGETDGLVAISGHLGLRDLPETCHDARLGPYGAFCARIGILAQAPWAADTGFAQLGAHLHPQFPVGVRVPFRVTEVGRSGWAASAAVVIARLDDPRARRCVPVGRHCGEELVVERVAWVEGEDYPRTVTVDPAVTPDPGTVGSLAPAARRATSHLPEGSMPLLTALVRPGTITWMDPAMASEVAGLDEGAVWYVRALDHARTPSAIDWVVADSSGALLLRGSTPLAGG